LSSPRRAPFCHPRSPPIVALCSVLMSASSIRFPRRRLLLLLLPRPPDSCGRLQRLHVILLLRPISEHSAPSFPRRRLLHRHRLFLSRPPGSPHRLLQRLRTVLHLQASAPARLSRSLPARSDDCTGASSPLLAASVRSGSKSMLCRPLSSRSTTRSFSQSSPSSPPSSAASRTTLRRRRRRRPDSAAASVPNSFWWRCSSCALSTIGLMT
jgi:hypothetical protein